MKRINFPKYIKCKTKEGTEEWVVRLYDEQMDNEKGEKVKTPENLLNRYYTLNNYPKKESIFKDRKDKKRIYLKHNEVLEFSVN